MEGTNASFGLMAETFHGVQPRRAIIQHLPVSTTPRTRGP